MGGPGADHFDHVESEGALRDHDLAGRYRVRSVLELGDEAALGRASKLAAERAAAGILGEFDGQQAERLAGVQTLQHTISGGCGCDEDVFGA